MKFFDIFSESWKNYKYNFPAILIIFFFLSIIPSIILSFIGLPMVNLSQQEVTKFYITNQGILYLTVSLALFFVSILMTACFVFLSLNAEKKLKAKEIFSGALKYWGRYILLIVFIYLIMFVLFIPALISTFVLLSKYDATLQTMAAASMNNLAILTMLLFVLGIILAIVFLVRRSLSIIVMMKEDKKVLASLKRSKELVAGKFWKLFGYFILLVIILILISFVFSFVGNLINGFTGNVIKDTSVTPVKTTLTTAGYYIALIFSLASSLVTTALSLFFLKNLYSALISENKAEIKTDKKKK